MLHEMNKNIITIIPCPSKLMVRDVHLNQPDPSRHEARRELRQALGSIQEEVRTGNGQNGVSAVGVERGLTVLFGSIQGTACPFKHWFHRLPLSSVLRRPERSQALEVTPLQLFSSTVTTLCRRE